MLSFLALLGTLVAPTLRLATPLIFAGLGGTISENSGVTNIGLEGMMVMGAFFAVLGSYVSGSALVGILFAMLAGAAIAAIHAVLSISLKADQIISGTAINLFSTAMASFLIFKIFKKGGQTDIVNTLSYNIPSFIKDIPYFGKVIGGLNWFVFLAFFLVFLLNFVLYKTPLGLRIRSVGEHPKAADTLGVNVYAIRYFCVIMSGVLAALGGATVSIGIGAVYREGMISGRGFIALAAMIFGNWKPIGTMWACLLFGFADAFQISAQSFGWSVPSEFYSAIPYVLTMLALAGFVGKTTAPAADGVPYNKGEK